MQKMKYSFFIFSLLFNITSFAHDKLPNLVYDETNAIKNKELFNQKILAQKNGYTYIAIIKSKESEDSKDFAYNLFKQWDLNPQSDSLIVIFQKELTSSIILPLKLQDRLNSTDLEKKLNLQFKNHKIEENLLNIVNLIKREERNIKQREDSENAKTTFGLFSIISIAITSLFLFKKNEATQLKIKSKNQDSLMDSAWAKMESNLTKDREVKSVDISTEERNYLVKKYGVGINQMTLSKAHEIECLVLKLNNELKKGR
jgi:uncharacterized membrane protein YgcG